MRRDIYNRVIEEGMYIIRTKETVRQLADVFGVSKSTVHKDLSVRLMEIDSKMYEEVCNIFSEHYNERHIRGGEATRRKFIKENAN